MSRTLLVLAALTATAHADRPKLEKLTLAVPTKPAPSTAAIAPSYTGTPAGPPSLQSMPRSEHEQILKELIANTPDAEVEEKSDYLFRLGELYGQVARVARDNGDEKATRDAATKADATYKQLIDTPAFRNYPKMDMALFEYGYVMKLAGQDQTARRAFDRLLKSYPNSLYVPDAHLMWADAAFDAGQLADAEARYNQVLKFPKAGVYGYAMYRAGFVNLARAQSTEALERFSQVAQATKNDAKQTALHDAAARDFARVYADVGKLDKALVAFKRLDAIGYPSMLGALADRLVEQGKPDKAIGVYTDVIAAEPDHPEVCNWMTGRAHAVAYAGSKQWVEVCASEAGVVRAWARNNGGTSN